MDEKDQKIEELRQEIENIKKERKEDNEGREAFAGCLLFIVVPITLFYDKIWSFIKSLF